MSTLSESVCVQGACRLSQLREDFAKLEQKLVLLTAERDDAVARLNGQTQGEVHGAVKLTPLEAQLFLVKESFTEYLDNDDLDETDDNEEYLQYKREAQALLDMSASDCLALLGNRQGIVTKNQK